MQLWCLKDNLIKDRIISGIADQEVKNRLLREEELTLEKCKKICRTADLADIQVKTLNDEESKIQVIKSKNKNQNKDFKEKRTNKEKRRSHDSGKSARGGSAQAAQGGGSFVKEQQGQRQGSSNCTRCGRQHASRQCPAYGKTCNVCKGMNHFANACRKRDINEVKENSADYFLINSIRKNERTYEWLETINVNNRFKVLVKLDSGAHCNVMSCNEFERVKDKVRLDIPKASLSSYGGSSIQVIGTCKLKCKFNNRDEKVI